VTLVKVTRLKVTSVNVASVKCVTSVEVTSVKDLVTTYRGKTASALSADAAAAEQCDEEDERAHYD